MGMASERVCTPFATLDVLPGFSRVNSQIHVLHVSSILLKYFQYVGCSEQYLNTPSGTS